jgi:uncharacterized membrane protein (UPF0182 family)
MYNLIIFNNRFFLHIISYFILKGIAGARPTQQNQNVQPTQSQCDEKAITSQIIASNTPTVALTNSQTIQNMGSSNEASNDLYNNDGDNRTIIMDELKNTDLADTIQGWFNYNIIYTA